MYLCKGSHSNINVLKRIILQLCINQTFCLKCLLKKYSTNYCWTHWFREKSARGLIRGREHLWQKGRLGCFMPCPFKISVIQSISTNVQPNTDLTLGGKSVDFMFCAQIFTWPRGTNGYVYTAQWRHLPKPFQQGLCTVKILQGLLQYITLWLLIGCCG